MFRIDNYVEHWAEIYKPISHRPDAGSKERRFYRIDALTSIPSFLTNLTSAKSPSVAAVTRVDGSLTGQSEKFVLYTYSIFFLVKQAGTSLQNGVTEELAATDAKIEGAEMAQDFLAWMNYDYRVNKNKELEGLNFRGASFFTTPQKFNGWWPTNLVIEHLRPRILCVNKEKYDDQVAGNTLI